MTSLSLSRSLVDYVAETARKHSADEGLPGESPAARDKRWATADESDPMVREVLENEAAQSLRSWQELFVGHVEVFATDADGHVVAATAKTTDYEQADEEWWAAAHKNGNGGVYVGPPDFDESSRSWSLQIAVPIRDLSSDEILGVLRSTYRLSALRALLNPEGPSRENFAVHVLWPDGTLWPSGNELPVVLNQSTLEALRNARNDEYVEMSLLGRRSLISEAPIEAVTGEPEIAALGLVAVVRQDRGTALDPVSDQRRVILVGSLFVLAFAALLGAQISGRLSRPIVDLTAATVRLAAGDLDARVPHADSADEIGQLGTTFNVMADRLEESIRTLEDRVAERTQDLQQQAHELQEALDTEARFFARMSHDLRTPLNSIIGFSSILSQGMAGELTEPQREQAAMILNSGRHLLALVNDILDISQIQSGHLELHPEELPTCEFVDQLVAIVRPLAEQRGLELVLEYREVPECVRSDKERLRQILLNLLGNAIKFTDEGRVSLTIHGENDRVVFVVQDTGPGIPPEDQVSVFEEFSRTSRPPLGAEGAGLGLPIVRHLCRALGGEVRLHSEPGVGSTFTVDLPVC